MSLYVNPYHISNDISLILLLSLSLYIADVHKVSQSFLELFKDGQYFRESWKSNG